MAARFTPTLEKKDYKETDYIDKLLEAESYTINDGIVYGSEYVIDGFVYKENIKVTSNFREFIVYSHSWKMDDYADTPGFSIEDDSKLQLTIQDVPNGVIINSNVYLTYNQWNTIYAVTEESRRCAVCDMACDVTEHVRSSIHKANMERYKPINKYDLSITRMINSNYHCGVCNALFHKSLKDEHFSSKDHEDKQLFAINKVSDLMYDIDIHSEKKDSYHFNAKAINNDIELSSEDEYEYEDFEECSPYDGHFQNEDDYYEYEEPPQHFGKSYASMARKPKDDLPEVLEIDLGKKKATVKFDSWNMVNRTKRRNLIYCMACKVYEHIRRKAEHCRSEDHINRLQAIRIVDAYENYLVRQVSDKLYHCGHCNNLQLIHEMKDHIESEHSNVPTHLPETAKKPTTPVKRPANNDTPKTKADKAINNVASDDNITTDVATANNVNVLPITLYKEDIFDALRLVNNNFDDIVICAFGSKVRISKIAFNIVCQGERDFYCGLCEINISMDMLKIHLNDMQHLSRLVRTPFIGAFNIHLFREIRDALHCALCNELVLIVPDMILKHKILERHIVKFARAVTYDNVDNPINNVNKAIDNKHTVTHNNVAPNAAKATDNNNTVIHNNVAPNATKATDNKNTVIHNNVAPNATKATDNKGTVIHNNIAPNATKATDNKNTVIHNNVAPTTKAIDKNTVTHNNVASNETQANNNNRNAVTHENVTPTKAVKTSPIVNKDKNAVNKPKKETIDIVETYSNRIEDVQKLEINYEEFVVVKNGVKDVTEDLDESFTEEFDYEELVYVKFVNSYVKITNAAYNTLVHVGDGGRYCFVCSSAIETTVSNHVDSRRHIDNLANVKFIDKYNDDLFRQYYLIYHCGICNVVVSSKQIKEHLNWPFHLQQKESVKHSARTRKAEIKNGTKQIIILQSQIEKENIYLNERERDVKIFRCIAIEKGPVEVERKNKIVIFNDNVLKVGFDCWHSISATGEGYWCKMCQCDLEEKELGAHVSSETHRALLDKIDKQYAPAMIRKITDTTLNCIICNSEIANNKCVTEHIQGKKHVKHYEAILKKSSETNSYSDCDQDVLML